MFNSSDERCDWDHQLVGSGHSAVRQWLEFSMKGKSWSPSWSPKGSKGSSKGSKGWSPGLSRSGQVNSSILERTGVGLVHAGALFDLFATCMKIKNHLL